MRFRVWGPHLLPYDAPDKISPLQNPLCMDSSGDEAMPFMEAPAFRCS